MVLLCKTLDILELTKNASRKDKGLLRVAFPELGVLPKLGLYGEEAVGPPTIW